MKFIPSIIFTEITFDPEKSSLSLLYFMVLWGGDR